MELETTMSPDSDFPSVAVSGQPLSAPLARPPSLWVVTTWRHRASITCHHMQVANGGTAGGHQYRGTGPSPG